MLRRAFFYQDELVKKLVATWDDPFYQYYHSRFPDIDDLSKDDTVRQFVSVDSKDNILGYICYNVKQLPCIPDIARSFSIIAFDRLNLIFLKDVKQAIDDIFLKYKCSKMDFGCFSDNPALELYRKFISIHGGRQCGYYRNESASITNSVSDWVEFEIHANEYVSNPYKDKEQRLIRVNNCPMCGSMADVNGFDLREKKCIFWADADKFRIKCSNTDCMLHHITSEYDSLQNAIDSWNRRYIGHGYINVPGSYK